MKKMFAVCAFAIICVLVLVYFTFKISRSPNDSEHLYKEAVTHLNNSGGEDRVCSEAANIFKRFGTHELYRLSVSDLHDYPKVAALGKVDGIEPEVPSDSPESYKSPACIKIRVGNHVDGYIMIIIDTNSPYTYPKASNAIQINPCIFVLR